MFPPSHRSPHLPSATGLSVLQLRLRVLAAAPDPCRAGTDLASPCLEAGRGERGGGGGQVGVFACSAGLSQTHESDWYPPIFTADSFQLHTNKKIVFSFRIWSFYSLYADEYYSTPLDTNTCLQLHDTHSLHNTIKHVRVKTLMFELSQ